MAIKRAPRAVEFGCEILFHHHILEGHAPAWPLKPKKRRGRAGARPSKQISVGFIYFFFTNVIAAEFMQYRNPVGFGPSSNTCPKCASHLAHRTSVRFMP